MVVLYFLIVLCFLIYRVSSSFCLCFFFSFCCELCGKDWPSCIMTVLTYLDLPGRTLTTLMYSSGYYRKISCILLNPCLGFKTAQGTKGHCQCSHTSLCPPPLQEEKEEEEMEKHRERERERERELC